MFAELRGYFRAQVRGGVIAKHADGELADIAATTGDVHKNFNVGAVRSAAQRYTGDTKIRRGVGSRGLSDTSNLIDREDPFLFHQRGDPGSDAVTLM